MNAANETKRLLRAIVDEQISLPDDALILDPGMIRDVFTQKRIELLQAIAETSPKSLSDLGRAMKRSKQSINRDLRFLESHGIIGLEKEGRTQVPKVRKWLLVYPIGKPATT